MTLGRFKIMAVSIDQSVRGLRHKQYRPDLMIADDIEDLQSVKTKEGRDKTYGWVKGELIPAGDTQTQVVFIGNLLHEDCLLKRLEREIKSNELQGIYCEYPLLDEHETCIWPGKYPTSGHIDIEKQRIGSEAAWQREFLLHIISDAERVIFPEWIQYYDQLPSEGDRRFLHTATGIDLAISQNDSADYTAMVSGKVYRIDGKIRSMNDSRDRGRWTGRNSYRRRSAAGGNPTSTSKTSPIKRPWSTFSRMKGYLRKA
jgi:hypothetical protein